MSMKHQLRMNRGSIKAIDRHSSADAFGTHDPSEYSKEHVGLLIIRPQGLKNVLSSCQG